MTDFESLKETITGFGVAKIALILLVALAIIAYVFFFPKTGAITLTVNALDGAELPGAEVTLSSSDGATVATEYSDGGGVASFKNVAPGDYDLSIDPGAGYKPASKSVSLESGGAADVSVNVEKISFLSIAAQGKPATLPLNCEQKIVFNVNNNGQTDENAELVADGGLKNFFSTRPSAVFVPAGGVNLIEGVFLASKGAAGDELTGRVRVKGTRNGEDFSFTLAGAPKITVSPEKISYNAAPGEILNNGGVEIIVSNEGGEPIAIRKEDIRIEGGYADSFDWTYFESTIPAHDKVSWWLALRVPEAAYGGLKLVGAVKIPLPCRTASIGIETAVTD